MTASNPILSILVATDLTAGSADAVRAAADLAIVTGARLHVIHGHAEPSMLSGGRDLLTVQRQVHVKRAELIDMIQGLAHRRTEIASARSSNKRAVLMRVKSGQNTKFVAVPVARG